MVPVNLPTWLQRFWYAMCVIEHVLGGHVEVIVLVLLNVHLLQLLQLASKVSSVAHQIHILYLTGFIWWWSQGSKLQFENFHQCPGDKMSGGELLGSTTLSTLKFCIWTLWCIYFEYPLSFPVAIHFLNSENSGQIMSRHMTPEYWLIRPTFIGSALSLTWNLGGASTRVWSACFVM